MVSDLSQAHGAEDKLYRTIISIHCFFKTALGMSGKNKN